MSLHLSLPGEKFHHIRVEVRHVQRSQVTKRQLAQLIRKLHATLQAALLAPLFYRTLHLRKWLGWCTERGWDLVSGLISMFLLTCIHKVTKQNPQIRHFHCT